MAIKLKKICDHLVGEAETGYLAYFWCVYCVACELFVIVCLLIFLVPLVMSCDCVSDLEGVGVGGEGNRGNFGTVFQNLPHSYTWPSKKRTHSYT